MKKFFLLSLFLMGCPIGPTQIECWYPTSGNSGSFGNPTYKLMGRTSAARTDLYGPDFRTQDELDVFVKRYNLKICGTNP